MNHNGSHQIDVRYDDQSIMEKIGSFIMKLRNPFYRERLPEWMSATAMLLACIQLLTLSNIDTAEGYTLFESVGISKVTVVYLLGLVGLARIIALTINGAWRQTPQIRKAGAIVGAVFFALLTIGGYLPALAFFIADVYAGYRAGYDSERIDTK